MTTKVFYEDPYLTEFEATVCGVGEDYIIIDKTCFYPEGGGQVGDNGTIGTDEIISTKEIEGEVRHFTSALPTTKEGQQVKCKINWSERLKTMRLHSLAHMIYLAFSEVVGKTKVIGSSVNSEKCRVDLAFFGNFDIQKVQEIIQKMISNSLEITTTEDKKKDGFRWWSLDGYPPLPCGGVHIRNASEIGSFEIKLKSLGKQGIRLYGTLK